MPRLRPQTPKTPQPKTAGRAANAHYPTEKLLAALIASKGMVAAAARMIGCDAGTIHDAAKREPIIQLTIDRERELQLDLAELALFTAIQKGEGWAVCFYLKCQGRKRGYVEKADVVLSGGVTLADLIVNGMEREAQATPPHGHA